MKREYEGKIYESRPEITKDRCDGCDLIKYCGHNGLFKESCITNRIIWKLKEEPKTTPSHLIDRHYVNNLWRWKCGLPEEESPVKVDMDRLRKEQMSDRFLELMRNRMALGTLRYGRWQEHKSKGVIYDRVGAMRLRLLLFEQTGNTEYLVDVANFAMIEFEISDHPNKHFSPKDDGEHVSRFK